ncbi:MAG: hypothetical protein QE265_01225 [Rhodoferax sp.]|nr:hypothetical protein [Rhodoferax sp.]
MDRRRQGVDVSAYQLVFTGEAVKHVLKNHGDPLVEAARKPAQAAVTAEDFALISEIAKQFDDVLPNNVQGKAAPLPSVMLRWALPIHLHQPAVQASVVLEVRTNKKRPRVAVKTLYKRLLKGDPRGE